MTNYNPITPEIVAKLAQIVGAANVILDKEKLEAYSHDETPKDQFSAMPEVIVTPTSTQQVAEIMKLANVHLIPVTPRGAGSGLSGGAIPLHGGILMAFEKMNKVLDVDLQNMMIEVQAGIVTNEINAVVADDGLFFAGYPMSLESCQIGGNIAENAGGGKAIKYGVTERYITGMEVVTPAGEILKIGGKIVKDVSGYDLKRLYIGSEGTLGIVTSATIKLTPLPKAKTDLLVLFPDVQSAIEIVPMIVSQLGIIPTSIEFMDRLAVETSCKYLNEHLDYESCGSMLLIEVDGTTQDQVDGEAEMIGDLCMEHHAIEVYVADNYTTQERVWAVRRNIAEAFKVVSPHQSLEDIVVPIAQIPALIGEISKIAAEFDLSMPSYGHAGDGNLHTTLIKPPEMPLDQWYVLEDQVVRRLYEVVMALGGKLSGEHGIGIKRKAYFQEIVDPHELELMRTLKQALDPNNILNPGKIFDLD